MRGLEAVLGTAITKLYSFDCCRRVGTAEIESLDFWRADFVCGTKGLVVDLAVLGE